MKLIFLSGGVNTSFGFSFGSFDLCRTPNQVAGSQFLCFYNCLISRIASFSSIETSKLAVSLFCEIIKTNLFVLDSVKTSFGSSFGYFDMN
jgi:hypothetical protein